MEFHFPTYCIEGSYPGGVTPPEPEMDERVFLLFFYL